MLLSVFIYAVIGVPFVLCIGCGEYKDCISCSTTTMIKNNQIRCTWVNDTCKELSEEEYKENNQPKKWYKFFEQCHNDSSYKTQMKKYFFEKRRRMKLHSDPLYKINLYKYSGIYAPENTFLGFHKYTGDPNSTLYFGYSLNNLKEDDKFLLVVKDRFGVVAAIQDKEEFFSQQYFDICNNTFDYAEFYIYYFNTEEKHQPPFQINYIVVFHSSSFLYSIIIFGCILSIIFFFPLCCLYVFTLCSKITDAGFEGACTFKVLCMCFYCCCPDFWYKHCYDCYDSYICSCCKKRNENNNNKPDTNEPSTEVEADYSEVQINSESTHLNNQNLENNIELKG